MSDDGVLGKDVSLLLLCNVLLDKHFVKGKNKRIFECESIVRRRRRERERGEKKTVESSLKNTPGKRQTKSFICRSINFIWQTSLHRKL